MMKYILILIVTLTNCIARGQDQRSIPFDENSFNLKSSLSSAAGQLQHITTQIKNMELNDTQKLFLIAGWMYDNIAFDIEKFEMGEATLPTYQSVLSSRQAICTGYAVLFAAFCNQFKITNELVEGYVQELGAPRTTFKETNHIWNVVKLGDQWFHCDLLWMSGGITEAHGDIDFRKKLDKSVFLTQSRSFIQTHIPADPMWQLSAYPLAIEHLIHQTAAPKELSNTDSLNYTAAIDSYIKLNQQAKKLMLAENAFKYNKDNGKIMVFTYYNAAVDILNTNTQDKKQLARAKNYLLKSRQHLPYYGTDTAALEKSINSILKTLP